MSMMVMVMVMSYLSGNLALPYSQSIMSSGRGIDKQSGKRESVDMGKEKLGGCETELYAKCKMNYFPTLVAKK